MKHLITLCLGLFALSLTFGQTEGISYQAVLVDTNPDEIPGVDVPANSLANQALTVQFSILGASDTVEYQETHNTETDAYGTINLMIGLGTITSQSEGTFDSIRWDGAKQLRVDIDLDAGNNFTEFSRQELTYVPYVRHRDIVAEGDVAIEGTTSLQNTLEVEGTSRFLERVTIEARMQTVNQSDIDAYPLRLEGSDHGMAISLNSANPSRQSNFMSFWDASGTPIGRIEGFQAFSDVNQGFILEVLQDNEPTEDEAKEKEDDDTAPPAPAPGAFDIYLNNDYSLNLLLEYIDLLEASASFGFNLGACIAGVGIAGDCDDAVWSAFALFAQGVQISLYVAYHETNVGVAFESGGADYAEWLKKSDVNEVMTFGEVVGVKAGVISKSFLEADHFMVVSKSPIVSGAMPAEQDQNKYKQIAFLGQVPVKVLGEVNKGDYILPSGNGDGLAIAVTPDGMRVNDYDRIIGVAWSEYHGNELFSYINTAVGINSNDLTRTVSEMQARLNAMQQALVEVNPNYRPNYYDVGTVSVANTIQTTRSRTLEELMAGQYEVDITKDTQGTFLEINELMHVEDRNNDHFKFSELPYLEKVLTDPTPENIEEYTNFYQKAKERLMALVSGLGE